MHYMWKNGLETTSYNYCTTAVQRIVLGEILEVKSEVFFLMFPVSRQKNVRSNEVLEEVELVC
jgi:hypothetical protein